MSLYLLADYFDIAPRTQCWTQISLDNWCQYYNTHCALGV